MKSIFRPFPLPLTGRQKFYLFVLQGLGAGIIDGGANFGIAYAMYGKQDVVKMWIFSQNTIAGDLGVTPIIQCLASMIISSTLVHTDLHNSKIRPLAFVYPHVDNLPDPRTLFGRSGARSDALRGVVTDDAATVTGSASASASVTDEKRRVKRSTSESTTAGDGKHGLSYYYWMLVRFIFEGTEQNMLLAKPGIGAWFGRLAWTAAQGAAIGIVFGFPLWCLAIIILGPIYRMDNMGSKWAPQIIKGVYGAIVGWVTNPVIAILVLGSQAEQSLLVVEVDEERATSGQEGSETQEELTDEGIGGVQTIPEDEILSPPGPIGTATGPRRASSAAGSFRLPPAPPTPGRSRAGSGTSSYRTRSSSPIIHTRPPLTANTSWLSPLPSPSAESSGLSGSGRSRARSNADSAGYTLAPPLSPIINRQRGATVSHPSPTNPNPESSYRPPLAPMTPRTGGTLTPRTFSYALGGSGGRAQRSRSASIVSQVPSVLLSPDLGQGELRGERGVGGRSRQASAVGESGTGVWDMFRRRESVGPVPAVGEQVKEG